VSQAQTAAGARSRVLSDNQPKPTKKRRIIMAPKLSTLKVGFIESLLETARTDADNALEVLMDAVDDGALEEHEGNFVFNKLAKIAA
jgi:hypothetical protein